MAPSARDRISVDLHGLKAALVARARAQQVDVSALVRRAVERELDATAATSELSGGPSSPRAAGATVKLSIRLTSADAAQLAASAARGATLAARRAHGLIVIVYVQRRPVEQRGTRA